MLWAEKQCCRSITLARRISQIGELLKKLLGRARVSKPTLLGPPLCPLCDELLSDQLHARAVTEGNQQIDSKSCFRGRENLNTLALPWQLLPAATQELQAHY